MAALRERVLAMELLTPGNLADTMLSSSENWETVSAVTKKMKTAKETEDQEIDCGSTIEASKARQRRTKAEEVHY